MADLNKELEKIYKITAVIGWMMAVSVLIYAGLIEFLVRSGRLDNFNFIIRGAEYTEYIFAGLAILYYMFISKIRKSSYKKAAGVSKHNFPSAIAGLYNKSVIILALCESAAVAGIALFFLTGVRKDFYVFAAASLLYFIIFFPRLSEWKNLLKI